MMQTKNVLVDLGGAEHQPTQPLDGWNPKGSYGKPQLGHQLEGWRPGEIDGTQITEIGEQDPSKGR